MHDTNLSRLPQQARSISSNPCMFAHIFLLLLSASLTLLNVVPFLYLSPSQNRDASPSPPPFSTIVAHLLHSTWPPLDARLVPRPYDASCRPSSTKERGQVISEPMPPSKAPSSLILLIHPFSGLPFFGALLHTNQQPSTPSNSTDLTDPFSPGTPSNDAHRRLPLLTRSDLRNGRASVLDASRDAGA